tara:strand:+ start:4649 stop:5221 length:573 start_codon:yes stop_codon:yes gene_type:complete
MVMRSKSKSRVSRKSKSSRKSRSRKMKGGSPASKHVMDVVSGKKPRGKMDYHGKGGSYGSSLGSVNLYKTTGGGNHGSSCGSRKKEEQKGGGCGSCEGNHDKKQVGGSDWKSTLYSRSVSTPMNAKKHFTKFANKSNYISHKDLMNPKSELLSGGRKKKKSGKSGKSRKSKKSKKTRKSRKSKKSKKSKK